MMKGTDGKPMTNILLNSERLNAFFPRSWTRHVHTHHFHSNIVLEILVDIIRQEKSKGIQMERKEVKLFYSYDHLCRKCDEIYLKNCEN